MGKTILSANTNFLYDGPNPAQELNGATVTANLLTGGIDERFQRTDATGTSNYLTDALGSTIALTDTTGNSNVQYSYAPFGSVSITGTTANSYTYTGRETDGLGINYYRARYYDPATGRFLSEDPMGFAGSGPNLYAYAGDDPMDFNDPFGLDKKRGLLTCASDAASQSSIASGIKYLIAQGGNGPSASRDFIIDALAGNTLSGLTDLGHSIITGEGGGHSTFHNMAQGVTAGPTQGLSPLFGKALDGTPLAFAPTDLAVAAGYSYFASDWLGSLHPAQAFTETLTGEGLEFASGVGELKLAYDAGSYLAGLAECAGGFIN